MGRRNYLVEGVSGTGKTSVCDELQRRGHQAIHGDRELAYQGDPATGAAVPGHTHAHHLWRVERVRALVADQEHAVTFLCGGSRNYADFVDLLDGVFVLEVDLDTLTRRLDARPDDEWGGRPPERTLVERLHQTGEDTPDGVVIDATAPLPRVVDEILRRTAVAEPTAAEATSPRPATRVRPVSRTAVPGLPRPGRTLVMGVVNVTPDSFSDGGEWFDPEAAIEHGRQLLAEGADLVDVGGESTRPGALRPSIAEELRRVLPVIAALSNAGAVVSVDTMRAEVAEQAVRAGARLVNDVSGGRADPDLLPLVARLEVPYICMHWRGHSEDMQSRAVYADVVADVAAELSEQVAAAEAAGIRRDRLVIDPGIGFAKTGDHNWELLQRLDELTALGLPLLLGVSRKAFLGSLLTDQHGRPRAAKQRDDATTALTALLAAAGVWGLRVHSVRASRDAVAVAGRLRR